MGCIVETNEQVLTQEHRSKLKRLRAKIDEGDQSGSPVPFDVEIYLAAKLGISANASVTSSRR